MRWVDHEGSCAAALWGLSHPRIFITHQQKAPPERSERGFYLPFEADRPRPRCRESGPLFASPRLYGGGNSLMVSPAKF